MSNRTEVISAGVIPYPLTSIRNESQTYRLTVNGTVVPVEQITKFKGAVVHYARLDCAGADEYQFEIIVAGEIGPEVSISPKRAGIEARVDGNRICFSTREPMYLVIRIPGQEDLFILADAVDANAPKPGDAGVKNILSYPGVDNTGETECSEAINRAIADISASTINHTLYFPSGTYLAKQLNMQSNVTIYLEGGATIQAWDDSAYYPDGALLHWEKVSNAKLMGRGCLEGNGRVLRPTGSVHNIGMRLCKNCVVEGITEIDSAFWGNHIEQCEDIHFADFKVMNYRPAQGMCNSDGLNFDSSRNCSLNHGFLYTGDDNCVVKGTLTGDVYSAENITFENYIGYGNSGACKVGTETTVDRMAHILFKNVDVVACDRALIIDGYDNARIKDVTFEDIYIESIAPQGVGQEPSQFIEFLVTNDAWRPCEGKCVIEDVVCRNVYAAIHPADFPSDILGRTAEYGFHGITMDNVRVLNDAGREVVLESAQAGAIRVNEYVEDMRFI